MEESTEKNYRCERKFTTDMMSAAHVMALVKIHPSIFIAPYPPRYVNNIYLDTKDMTYYHENVVGAKDRRKARIRWYGDLLGDIKRPVLEFKIKDGFVGTKEQYSFPPFSLDTGFNINYFKEILNKESLSREIKYYLRDLDPVLVNRYYRWYFATRDGEFRLTVDHEMSYYNIRPLRNNFLYHHIDHTNIIVEIKYNKELDHRAGHISHFFPFALTRSSKYVQGIERVYI
jgi:SPX domain protein involved in polyphosphate accumulation